MGNHTVYIRSPSPKRGEKTSSITSELSLKPNIYINKYTGLIKIWKLLLRAYSTQ